MMSQSTAVPIGAAHQHGDRDKAIDRIIDLYYYESVGTRRDLQLAGKGAYCYAGSSTVQTLGGTPIESWVDELSAYVRNVTRPEDEDFRVEYDGRSFRACRDRDRVAGITQVSLRRLPGNVPSLDDLRIGTPGIRKLLTSPWLNPGGLIVFSGLTGQGKTTFSSATVRTRLEKFGGRGVSVEDVLELPIEGVWGIGSFRQIQVDYNTTTPRAHGFAGAVRRAYRSMPAAHPAILYVGEVRDAETATEVVKAASNGMLVVTTIHAGSPTMALTRLIGLAESSLGAGASTAIAQALRMVVQTKLTYKNTATGWNRGQFETGILLSDGPSHAVAAQVTKQSFAQLANLQESQQAKLEQIGESPAVTAHTILKALGSHGEV